VAERWRSRGIVPGLQNRGMGYPMASADQRGLEFGSRGRAIKDDSYLWDCKDERSLVPEFEAWRAAPHVRTPPYCDVIATSRGLE
jgi:hypothetical protein